GFAAIIGECLLEVAGIWSDVRNHKSNQNCPAIQRFLVIELPASTIELANRRLAERTAANGREVQTPLVGLWIVQAQTHPLEVAGGTIGHKFDQVGATVPEFAHNRDSVVLDPSARTSQGMHQPFEMCSPVPEFEVEVVLAVSTICDRRARLRLRQARK